MYRPLAWLLALVATLVLAPAGLLVARPLAISAQEVQGETVAGEGISFDILPGATEGRDPQAQDAERLQPYLFTFQRGAYIPEEAYPEAIIAQVIEGNFAFRVGPEDLVIVDPNDEETITIVEPTGPPDPDPANAPSYNDIGVVIGDDNRPCTTICAIRAGDTVQLDPGDTIYLPDNTTCFWCNVSGFAAQLRVFARLPAQTDATGFSWTQLQGIGTLQAEATPTARRWAGIATHCR